MEAGSLAQRQPGQTADQVVDQFSAGPIEGPMTYESFLELETQTELGSERAEQMQTLGSRVLEFAQSSVEKVTEQAQTFGSRVSEIAHISAEGFSNLRKNAKTNLGVLATSATTLIGGAAYSAVQPTESLANPSDAQTRSLKRHSTMTPQKALNKISWAAAPIIQNKWTKPTSGSLTANTAKFKSNCAAGTGGPWRHLTVNPWSVGYKACGVGAPPYYPDTHLSQFKKPLNKLGNNFISSVGLTYQQNTKKVTGNRSKVTATLVCPKGVTNPDTGQVTRSAGVKNIAVTKKGRATITKC